MMRRTIAAMLLCLAASPAAALCPSYLPNDAFFRCFDQERAIQNQQFQIEQMNRQMNEEMDQLWKRQERIEQERARREGRIHIPTSPPIRSYPW